MKLEDRLRPYVGELESQWEKSEDGTFLTMKNAEETLRFVFLYSPEKLHRDYVEVVVTHTFEEEGRLLSPNYPLFQMKHETTEWLKENSSYRLLFLCQNTPIKWNFLAHIQYQEKTYNYPIEQLEFTFRASSTLQNEGYRKIGDLQWITESYLQQIHVKSQKEIREKMKEWGISLCR